MSIPLGRCRACHRPVRWAKNVNGKLVPLDPEPAVDGTMAITEENGVDVARLQPPVPGVRRLLYVLHFVTCPDGGRSGKAATRRALQRALLKGRTGL